MVYSFCVEEVIMSQYEFKREIKETVSQFKKHYSQFTPKELSAIKRELGKIDINNIRMSSHAKEHITLDRLQLKAVFSAYDIIEFNATYREKVHCRVLIRGRQPIDIVSNNKLIKAQACVVYDISSKMVVSIYMNDKNDKHETLRNDRYGKVEINICDMLDKQ